MNLLTPVRHLAWDYTFRKLNTKAHWARINEFDRLDPGGQRRYLSRQLLATIQQFGNRDDALPVWRDLARGASAEEVWSEWGSLPIVTKRDIQERFVPENIRDRFGVQGRINTSGGSTGQPTRFIWDEAALQRRAAVQYYCWLQMGWTSGTPYMCLWGSPRDLGQAESRTGAIARTLRGFTLIDGYEFGNETVEQARNALDTSDRIAVYGYTTLLEKIAQAFMERGYRVPAGKVVTAWSGAEPLFGHQSDVFELAFGKPIHNQYGGREFGAIGYKLAHSSSFRLFRTEVFVEIVNENNEPCGPGEVGRLILTTLTGKGTPFIRYENGDLAAFGANDLDESGLTGLATIEGRTTGIIHLPDGRSFHSVFWHQLFKDYPEIKSFHVHQRQDASLDIHYIGQPFSDATCVRLERLIQNMVGLVPFEFHRVDTLPMTTSGKHLQVTSEYSPSA